MTRPGGRNDEQPFDKLRVSGVGYPCGMSGRIIALDLGKARSGVAVSDPTQTIAQPIDLLPGADAPTFVEQLGGVVAEYEAERVIVGIPRTMEGRMGEMAQWAEGIRRACERELSVPVEGRDERLSTVSAERAMREAGGRKGGITSPSDSIAAAVVLQAYLDEQRLRGGRE